MPSVCRHMLCASDCPGVSSNKCTFTAEQETQRSSPVHFACPFGTTNKFPTRWLRAWGAVSGCAGQLSQGATHSGLQGQRSLNVHMQGPWRAFHGVSYHLIEVRQVGPSGQRSLRSLSLAGRVLRLLPKSQIASSVPWELFSSISCSLF